MSLQAQELEKVLLNIDPARFPGFRCWISYIPETEIQEIGQKCLEMPKARGRGRRGVNIQVNRAKQKGLLAERAVHGWEGLKPEFLQAMIPINDEVIRLFTENGDGSMEYTTAAAEYLAINASDDDFFGVIDDVVSEWSEYRRVLEKFREGN